MHLPCLSNAQFCLGFLMVTGLWAYCSVFASSVLAIVPLFGCDFNSSAQDLSLECSHAYQVTLLVFAMVSGPSCSNRQEPS